jgi:hypothetical protein
VLLQLGQELNVAAIIDYCWALRWNCEYNLKGYQVNKFIASEYKEYKPKINIKRLKKTPCFYGI